MINLSQKNILTDNLTTLHETSFDSNNNQYMTTATYPAINFDAVKDLYVFENSSISSSFLRSNDALVIYNQSIGQFIFIEFKNGDITSNHEKEKIRSKITESLLILNDILNENLTFDRNNVNYILVYNKSKNTSFETQRNNSFARIASYIAGTAKMTYLINGFDRYRAFFHDVKTINETEFQTIAAGLQNSTYRF